MPKDFILCALFGEHFLFPYSDSWRYHPQFFFDDYYVNNSSMSISFCTKL